jgi:hypothetical protein
MEMLSPEENLVATVARATCFAYRVDAQAVPEGDVELYVEELINLYSRKPDARLARGSGNDVDTVADTVRFCADQLKDVAPAQAARLRTALTQRGGVNGPSDR